MSKKLRKYPQWFIEEIVDPETKQKALEGTLSTVSKVEFKCTCGNTYIQKITNHINLSTGERRYGNCPNCSKKIRAEKYRESIGTYKSYPQWFIDELVNEEDKEKALSGELKAEDKISFVCSVCGNVYIQRVASHITLSTGEKKKGCPKCGVKKQVESSRKTKEIIKPYPQWFIDDLYNEEDREKAKATNFYGNEEKQFYCKKHNIVYIQRVKHHIDLKTHQPKAGCPECKIEKFRKNKGTDRPLPEWFISDLVKDEDKNKAKQGILKTNDKVNIICPTCGYSFTRSAGYFLKFSTLERRYFCPICAKQRSNTELEIEEYIKSLGIITEHKRFCSSILKQFEVDIYIPEKNIAIEYNGSFWHKILPQDICNKQKMYHNQKYWSCRELGIQLISIFDVDWCYKKDKVKQYLKDLILPISEKLYARKCVVKEITKEEANSMYEEYHLLGRTKVQDVSYGLFYNNQLISCMSFQKGRYKDKAQPIWCLTRFVTKSGFSIMGGASKLLKHFEKEFMPTVLVSYSDNDYFTGNLYSILGFECLGDTKAPRYYWFLDGKEIKREQSQLKHLSKQHSSLYQESLLYDGNKEDYIMINLGAYKVYRSGHTKWIKKY